MSIAVGLDELREAATAHGPVAYLLSGSEDGRPHVVSAQPAWEGDSLVLAAGGRTVRNVGARPFVTLLWPAHEPDGYSLIVDGEATPGEGRVTVRPTSAVLHRPAPAPPERA